MARSSGCPASSVDCQFMTKTSPSSDDAASVPGRKRTASPVAFLRLLHASNRLDGIHVLCQVVWRKQSRIGVRFNKNQDWVRWMDRPAWSLARLSHLQTKARQPAGRLSEKVALSRNG